MAEIRLLDSNTIDKIAAGEVVERPSSVVKELVENAMDAGADAITVEIRDGGCSFIRVTDNGDGIEKDQIRKAFFRHATSKISTAEDLYHIHSLGFRGEALSSIAAVSMVELITKTKDSLTGIHYRLDGGVEKEFSEIGAPEGTTMIARELFFNTPVRKKFLKTPATEGSYVSDLMEHMALSRPDVAFQFMVNGNVRFHTSGNGDLKEIIYRIYGREIAGQLLPFHAQMEGVSIDGFLGSPSVVRSNRNFEFFFVNGRYIRSPLLSKGLEAGYKAWLMQHKFPFALLHLTSDPENIDVNVHPSKMEVRFSDQPGLYAFLEEQVREAMHRREMIPDVKLDEPAAGRKKEQPAPKEQKVKEEQTKRETQKETVVPPMPPVAPRKPVPAADEGRKAGPEKEVSPNSEPAAREKKEKPEAPQPFETARRSRLLQEEEAQYTVSEAKQMELFDMALDAAQRRGFDLKIIHGQNSAGISRKLNGKFNTMRAGIVLYGRQPSDEVILPGLKPAMSLKTIVTHIKTVKPGRCVSYGMNWHADRERKIATLAAGYADGVPRLLSFIGHSVEINGKSCPVTGNICMDQMMVDITDAGDIKIGDEALVLGGGGQLSMENVARKTHTIAHELMCAIPKRVPRVYTENGKICRIEYGY